MKNIILILLFAFLISSCHQKQSDKRIFIADDLAMNEEMVAITRQEMNSPPVPPLPPLENNEIP